MLDFKVVMLPDCTAALSDDDLCSALETVVREFGDAMTADEALDRLGYARRQRKHDTRAT